MLYLKRTQFKKEIKKEQWNGFDILNNKKVIKSGSDQPTHIPGWRSRSRGRQPYEPTLISLSAQCFWLSLFVSRFPSPTPKSFPNTQLPTLSLSLYCTSLSITAISGTGSVPAPAPAPITTLISQIPNPSTNLPLNHLHSTASPPQILPIPTPSHFWISAAKPPSAPDAIALPPPGPSTAGEGSIVSAFSRGYFSACVDFEIFCFVLGFCFFLVRCCSYKRPWLRVGNAEQIKPRLIESSVWEILSLPRLRVFLLGQPRYNLRYILFYFPFSFFI